MFRKTPEVQPIQCPFRNGPYTFVYNKGFGDCDNPASKAEMCTDDSRMVLKHQACADTSTESNGKKKTFSMIKAYFYIIHKYP